MKTRVQDELLTVQEFAERAGVSVQAVYKRLNNSLNPYIQLVEGRKMLKSSALYEIYGVKVEQPIQPSVQPELNEKSDGSEVDFLRKQVEQLQAELSKERQHSRELAERIVILADQAQKLQLAQLSPQVLEGSDGAAMSAPLDQQDREPKPEPKKGWLRKIFG